MLIFRFVAIDFWFARFLLERIIISSSRVFYNELMITSSEFASICVLLSVSASTFLITLSDEQLHLSYIVVLEERNFAMEV